MTTHVNSRYLYFDQTFDPHKLYVKKYVRPIRRTISEKLSKNAYTTLIIPNAVKGLNRWLKETCDDARRRKFHALFKQLAIHKCDVGNKKHISETIYDSYYNTAALYCHGILTDDSIHVVSSWLKNKATEEDKVNFKDIMSMLRATHEIFRPSTTYTNSFRSIPIAKMDKDLTKALDRVAMEKSYKKHDISLAIRMESGNQGHTRPHSSRQCREDANTEYNSTYKSRPSSAPISRAQATANAANLIRRNKPYSTHPHIEHPISTNKDAFKVQRVQNSRDYITSAVSLRQYDSDIEQTARMSFMPKSIIPTAVIGTIVPAYNNFLEDEKKELQGRCKQSGPSLKRNSDANFRTSMPTGGMDMKDYELKGKTIYGLSYCMDKKKQQITKPISYPIGKRPFATTSFTEDYISEMRDKYNPKTNKYDLQEYRNIQCNDKGGTQAPKSSTWLKKD